MDLKRLIFRNLEMYVVVILTAEFEQPLLALKIYRFTLNNACVEVPHQIFNVAQGYDTLTALTHYGV